MSDMWNSSILVSVVRYLALFKAASVTLTVCVRDRQAWLLKDSRTET